MRYYFIFILFILYSNSFAQDIYEQYPAGQTDYIGGNVQFYKDFHQVLKDKKLQPCENKNEAFSFRIVVYPDKKIKYVKSEDAESLEKNKCAFELTKEVAKYLTGWNPAVVDGNKVAALTSFWIIPHELFQELPQGYDPINDMEMATYEGGINNFRKKVFQSIDLSRFTFTGTFRLEVTFIVETDGKMSDVQLAQSTGLKAFDDMVIKSISQIRNKWTPGNIHGIPVRYRFRLPLAFKMD
ncbi:energy transducer TonB [Kaistella sp. BT6-1-3]|uniref:Energy transducer TonB n=1 Tax=Kaistella yananensis TaxID=2989820 RepID=A0ABT3JLC9_9FLAO|nr:energy transducer TonB [Kaistella yananensis]MCW4451526.1 energy transducer TonB [Kaistella yananensis]